MAKYLDPKADLTFKKVFGEHKELLISFLNAMLPLPEGKEIVEIEYKSPELIPVNPDKKDTIVDVRCTDNDKRNFIVEMQMYWTNAFKKRALLNTCKAYSYPADKGIKYSELKPVYTLSLVNDIAFPELEDCYHVYTLRHAKKKDYKIDDIQMIFVELPKFEPANFSDRKVACLWLRFLTEINEHTEIVSKDLLEDRNVSKAVKLVEESAYTEAELLAIDHYWDAVSRERTALSEKYDKGLEEGIAIGEERGIAIGEERGIAIGEERGIAIGEERGIAIGEERGIAIGEERGIAIGEERGIAIGEERERQKAREEKLAMALSMKQDGIPTSVIAKYTGLTEQEVKNIS